MKRINWFLLLGALFLVLASCGKEPQSQSQSLPDPAFQKGIMGTWEDKTANSIVTFAPDLYSGDTIEYSGLVFEGPPAMEGKSFYKFIDAKTIEFLNSKHKLVLELSPEGQLKIRTQSGKLYTFVKRPL